MHDNTFVFSNEFSFWNIQERINDSQLGFIYATSSFIGASNFNKFEIKKWMQLFKKKKTHEKYSFTTASFQNFHIRLSLFADWYFCWANKKKIMQISGCLIVRFYERVLYENDDYSQVDHFDFFVYFFFSLFIFIHKTGSNESSRRSHKS